MSRFNFGPFVAVAMLRALTVLLLALTPAIGRTAESTSLDKVPADAEAYGAVLRLGETFDIIAKSRAWQLLWNDSAVQEAWKKAHADFEADNNEVAPFKKFFADPANKDLPALAADVLSREIFYYAGAGWDDTFALLQEAAGYRPGPTFQKLALNDDDSSRSHVRIILEMLAQKPERIRIPDFVIGFKISDAAKVNAQLKRLEPLLAGAIKDTPLKGRSKRVRVGDDDFLALQLDGSVIPWDEIPLGMFEDKPGEFAKLIDYIKKQKVSVTVGVRQGYLLIALGESPEHIARFGGDGPKLSRRPEFKPLAKFADRPLTSIGYTSAKLRSAFATSKESIASLAELAKMALKKTELSDEERTAIGKDVDAFAKEFARELKKPKAEANFSFRTSNGWETYAYDYSDPEAGKSRPLALLNHLGGNPLLAVAWRSGTTVQDYQSLVKWLGVFAKHGEKIIAAEVPNGEEGIDKFHKEFLPLLKELDVIIEKRWFPALEDGQQALVVDGKWSSKRWHAKLQESAEALPMLELGIILGVSDSAKLQQALESFRLLANKFVVKLREQFPDMPDLEIPKPQVDQRSGNIFGRYPIPEEWGIDGQFQPTGGLSRKVAVVTLSRGHAERLLDGTPLKVGGVALSDPNRPLDFMFYCNWAGLVDVAAPWVRYAIQNAAPADELEKAERIGRKVLEVLKVFRRYTTVTYRENGVTITHSEAVFGDIEAERKK